MVSGRSSSRINTFSSLKFYCSVVLASKGHLASVIVASPLWFIVSIYPSKWDENTHNG